MKRTLSLIIFTMLCAACLYAKNVNVLMNDGTVIKGNMLGKTADTVYIEDTNGQSINVKTADIKSVFDQDTGDEMDLNAGSAPEDTNSAPPSTTNVVTNAVETDPDITVIPNTYVYYYTYDNYDCFFYGGYWWRPWGGFWYRSGIYNGGWVIVSPRFVPYYVVHLPGGWRASLSYGPRVGWGSVRVNWNTWQRGGYWAGHGWNRGYYNRAGVYNRGGNFQQRSVQGRPVNNNNVRINNNNNVRKDQLK
jgi:hypothetical protein